MLEVLPFLKVKPTLVHRKSSGIVSSYYQLRNISTIRFRFSSSSSFRNSISISSSTVGPGPGAFLLFAFLKYFLTSSSVGGSVLNLGLSLYNFLLTNFLHFL